ncbi:hypothetical protein L2750_12845 [Shewanella submarina]|uniref:Uncharacterized protein n=1 Tax=Shewanella submarina TaxID=2016376 RepID=A0ABV7GDV2_9GAMM|nr:hypothetical protein [Shewanella submarina]MCL1038037.1 hypothetical protein [Shewanella submarina]
MPKKPINPDIGEVTCVFTGETAPVRRDKNGNLYYVSSAGMIKPNLSDGQDWMLENCHIFGAAEHAPKVTPDDDIPDSKNDIPAPQDDIPENDKPLAVRMPKIPVNVRAKTPVNEQTDTVNEDTGQGAVNTPSSDNIEPDKPQSFAKWLIG